MLTLLAAAAAGLVCGVLSGFGIGGGSLLMVWMTAVLSMEQRAAQGVNLLYFLPCAACALIFHIKNKQIVWRAVWPAALAGSVCAVGGALLAQTGTYAWLGPAGAVLALAACACAVRLNHVVRARTR